MIRQLIFTGLLSTMMAAPAPSFADELSISAQTKLRINVAGRQRMLSQRMAKASCLMAEDVNATAAYDQMTQAFELFERTNTALRDGDEAMGLDAETHDSVLSALARVGGHWDTYRPIVEIGINEAFIEDDDLAALNEASLDVLKFMNIAVYKTARAWAESVEQVDLGLAITIDIAGRQRMLTQLAMKNVCLMRTSVDPTDYAEALANAVELFDSSLTALHDGFGEIGVVPPPNQEVARTLREVSELWQPVKMVMDRAANGQILSDNELSSLERDTESLLQTMNEAVGLYATTDSSS